MAERVPLSNPSAIFGPSEEGLGKVHMAVYAAGHNQQVGRIDLLGSGSQLFTD